MPEPPNPVNPGLRVHPTLNSNRTAKEDFPDAAVGRQIDTDKTESSQKKTPQSRIFLPLDLFK